MKTPTDADIQLLMHHSPYDPIKAHEYYMRVRQLKGRRKGTLVQPSTPQASTTGGTQAPHASKPVASAPGRKRTKGIPTTREKQKHELQRNITQLESKLTRLEELIKRKEAILARDHVLAKTRARQPKSKAQAAQKAKQYRQTHQQQIQQKAKQTAAKNKAAGGTGGGAKGKGTANTPVGKPLNKRSIAELKALATKVRGLLAVAKNKLAAL